MSIISSAGIELYADDSRLPQTVQQAVQDAMQRANFDQAGQQAGRDFETALNRVLSGLQVQVQASADTTQAQAQIGQLDSAAQPVSVPVTADPSQAQAAVDQLATDTQSAMGEAGQAGGEDLVSGVEGGIGSLASRTGPIVGAVLGAVAAIVAISPGKLIWDAIVAGMEQQSNLGLFQARTGLDADTAGRFGRAAGESYADNFGESIEDNIDRARVAFQAGLLGGESTQTEIETVLAGLDTVSLVLGEEVPAVARAAGLAVQNGLARTSDEAFGLFIRGAQAGLNVSEDLLDTVSEYGSTFRSLGLDGSAALGLLNQGLEAGVPNTDFFADALRELGIRVRENADETGAYIDQLGLVPAEIQAAFVQGGPAAAAALDQLLDALREVEDPVERQRMAVALLGTQFEDLNLNLDAIDLSAARGEFEDLEGVLSSAMDAIGNNPAAALESARRNIEVAKVGVQQALAAAFAPQIEDGANWISENREEVVQFLLDATNMALELARALVTAGASGLDTFASLAGLAAEFTLDMATALNALDAIPGVDLGPTVTSLTEAALGLNTLEAGATVGAEALRSNVIPAIDETQARLNSVGFDAVQQAAFSDASTRMAAAIEEVGVGVDGAKVRFDALADSTRTLNEDEALLEAQLRDGVLALLDTQAAGELAGRTNDELSESFLAGREALIVQAEAMGLTREQANKLVTSLGAVEGERVITIESNADGERVKVEALRTSIDKLTGKTVKLVIDYSGTGNFDTYLRPGMIGMSAEGGWVSGPGTGTSDSALFAGPSRSGLWRLSDGEFVVNADDAARNDKLLEYINNGGAITPAAPVAPVVAGGMVFSPTVVAPPGTDGQDLLRLMFAEYQMVMVGGSVAGGVR